MSKSIRIEPSPRTVKAVAATAKALRFRPEDIYTLAAGQLARHVKKHGCCIAPLAILPPETDTALRDAIRATGFRGEAPDLAEYLLADAVKRFKAGDYSLITDGASRESAADRCLACTVARLRAALEQALPLIEYAATDAREQRRVANGADWSAIAAGFEKQAADACALIAQAKGGEP